MAGGESEALRVGRLRRGFLTGFQEVQEAWVCVGIRRQGTGEQLGIDIGQANGGAAVFLDADGDHANGQDEQWQKGERFANPGCGVIG